MWVFQTHLVTVCITVSEQVVAQAIRAACASLETLFPCPAGRVSRASCVSCRPMSVRAEAQIWILPGRLGRSLSQHPKGRFGRGRGGYQGCMEKVGGLLNRQTSVRKRHRVSVSGYREDGTCFQQEACTFETQKGKSPKDCKMTLVAYTNIFLFLKMNISCII